MSGNAFDPDLTPIRPYAGSPDDPAAPRQAAAQAGRRGRPVVLPAEPRLWSVEVALELPVTVDGVPLDTVTVRRLTGDDIAELLLEDDEEETLGMRARARMCGLDVTVLRALAADDTQRVVAACRPFFPRLLADGEPTSAEPESLSPGEV